MIDARMPSKDTYTIKLEAQILILSMYHLSNNQLVLRRRAQGFMFHCFEVVDFYGSWHADQNGVDAEPTILLACFPVWARAPPHMPLFSSAFVMNSERQLSYLRTIEFRSFYLRDSGMNSNHFLWEIRWLPKKRVQFLGGQKEDTIPTWNLNVILNVPCVE